MAERCLLVAIIGGVVVGDLVLENPAPLRGANRAARLRGDPDRLRRFTTSTHASGGARTMYAGPGQHDRSWNAQRG
jgi:hypothetical protein